MASSLIFHKVYSQRQLVYQVLGSDSNLQSAGSFAYRPVARKMPHGRRAWQRKSDHIMTARKQRETEEARDKAHPSKNALDDLLLPIRPHILRDDSV